jgi:hypothetical protein
MVRRATADIERGRRVERRRKRLRRLAAASFAVGAGAVVVAARMGLPHRGPS